MIHVSPIAGDYSLGYVVTGHADFDEHGKDIVCSAVSALAQSCLLSLERHDQIDRYVESGYMRVRTDTPSDYTNLLINSMVLGLEHIQHTYPQYLHVEKEQSHDKDTRV